MLKFSIYTPGLQLFLLSLQLKQWSFRTLRHSHYNIIHFFFIQHIGNSISRWFPFCIKRKIFPYRTFKVILRHIIIHFYKPSNESFFANRILYSFYKLIVSNLLLFHYLSVYNKGNCEDFFLSDLFIFRTCLQQHSHDCQEI